MGEPRAPSCVPRTLPTERQATVEEPGSSRPSNTHAGQVSWWPLFVSVGCGVCRGLGEFLHVFINILFVLGGGGARL